MVLDPFFHPIARGSPGGVGLFLLCLGGFIYFLSLADKNKIKTKEKAKEKK